jgi:hypothetical protein
VIDDELLMISLTKKKNELTRSISDLIKSCKDLDELVALPLNPGVIFFFSIFF